MKMHLSLRVRISLSYINYFVASSVRLKEENNILPQLQERVAVLTCMSRDWNLSFSY